MNLQLRAELFNLPNHTNYSTPDNGVQDAQFSQILSAARPGREVQFALKLVFRCICGVGICRSLTCPASLVFTKNMRHGRTR
jgi:hypothetical protein